MPPGPGNHKPPPVRKTAQPKITGECERCGTLYVAKIKRDRPPPRFCSRRCSLAAWQEKGVATNKANARGPLRNIYACDCTWCGKLFIGEDSRTQFCSTGCTFKYRAEYARQVYRAAHPDSAAHAGGGCRDCGAVIERKGAQRCNKCQVRSKKLARQRSHRQGRLRRLKAISIREPYTLEQIAARDRFRCGLCRKRVAMTKTVPHPRAPTIDHIVPLSVSHDDTRGNVQLAHFECNWRKGATGGVWQAALFG